MSLPTAVPTIRVVGPDDAGVVLDVVRRAFADREPLDPPTDALAESEETIAARLAAGCGLLATVDGEPVATVLLDVEQDGRAVHLRRFGVVPAARGHRLAEAMVAHALRVARDLDGRVERAVVVAREELPHTVRFWRRQGFGQVDHRSPYVELARALPVRVEVPTADDMRALAGRVAGVVRAGDVLVLSGDLGAGKTTFTQGLGAALGVRGEITSPTFVIARVHPTVVGGPDLIHVDAYRLGGSAELDDLDLDTDVDHAVTVVEWGEGLAEDLAESPLVVQVKRARGGGDAAADADPRTVEVDPLGARWLGVDLAAVLRGGPEL